MREIGSGLSEVTVTCDPGVFDLPTWSAHSVAGDAAANASTVARTKSCCARFLLKAVLP